MAGRGALKRGVTGRKMAFRAFTVAGEAMGEVGGGRAASLNQGAISTLIVLTLPIPPMFSQRLLIPLLSEPVDIPVL